MAAVKEWEIVDSRMDRDYRVFKIGVSNSLSPRTNKVSEFYTIETNDWVNVIPLTEQGEVVMIKQYRHGSRHITLEIPGGLVDDEHPEQAAVRELMEETGYCGETVHFLGSTNPNPAIFNNLCHTYLVKNARKIAGKSLDPDEDIETLLVPLSEIPSLLETGAINHALVIVAFHFYYQKHSLP
jgi:ADP-ribose pyrophosphatase